MLSPQEALVYAMVVAAESDHDIAEAEVHLIGDLGNHLPIFRTTGRAKITRMAMACSELLAEADGRETVFGLVRAALSPQLRATAYALACDVIAVDGRLQPNEMQALEHIRAKLEVDPAVARAIERVAVIRFQAA
jgi:uncharacterized tellurite resistance protein B-like protein